MAVMLITQPISQVSRIGNYDRVPLMVADDLSDWYERYSTLLDTRVHIVPSTLHDSRAASHPP